MKQVLLVALGGALGTVGRYGVGIATARILGLAFPWGTLIVNALGALAIGVLTARVDALHPDTRLFIGVGLLGGFTTFSTFSLESLQLIQNGRLLVALGYVISSAALGICGAWVGFVLGR